jgi:hypothetical protein
VKKIAIGPNPPAFISPGVFKVLHDKFDLRLTGNDPAKDLAAAWAEISYRGGADPTMAGSESARHTVAKAPRSASRSTRSVRGVPNT